MGLFNTCREFSTWVCGRYGLDQGKALINLGAIALGFSSLAQIYMIKTSKDIAPEKKKFLIPQEIADGAISVGMVYTVSSYVKNRFDRAIENGKFYTPKTQEIAEKLRPHPVGIDTFIRGTGERLHKGKILESYDQKKQVTEFYKGLIKLMARLDKALSEIKRDDLIEEFEEAFKNLCKYSDEAERKALIKELKTAQMDFLKFKSGVSVISAIAAGAITAGLIVPVARNAVANKCQKKAYVNNNEKLRLNTPLSSSPVFNNFFKILL